MKKSFILFAFALSIIACNKASDIKEVKTAYVDTSKLLEEFGGHVLSWRELSVIDWLFLAIQLMLGLGLTNSCSVVAHDPSDSFPLLPCETV